MTSDGDDTRLGRQFDPFDEYFNGNMDELWVYSGTLTAEEVATLATVDSATWSLNPSSADWNTATNWTPAVVPDSGASIATFASSNVTAVTVSANTDVSGIVFNSGASAFTISVSASTLPQFTISGVGIANNSGITQNFQAAEPPHATIAFTNSAT